MTGACVINNVFDVQVSRVRYLPNEQTNWSEKKTISILFAI